LIKPWQWYVAVLSTLAVTILSATIIEVILCAGLIGIYIDSFAERRWYRWRRVRRMAAHRRARLSELSAMLISRWLSDAHVADERVRRMQEESEEKESSDKTPPRRGAGVVFLAAMPIMPSSHCCSRSRPFFCAWAP